MPAEAISPTQLRTRLLSAFPDATVDVLDLTGTQDHYQVKLVSEAFRGLRTVQQHRLVYRALGDAVGKEIHALALETRAP